MGVEIERKYLVRDDSWRHGADGSVYRQGYLTVDPDRNVRVRVAGNRATLTIKGKTEGIVRSEFEYAIPVEFLAPIHHRKEREDPKPVQPGFVPKFVQLAQGPH